MDTLAPSAQIAPGDTTAAPVETLDTLQAENRKAEIAAELAELGSRVKLTRKSRARQAELRQELIALESAAQLPPEPPPEPVPEPAAGLRLAKIYAVPKNRYLRLIEFEDGSMARMRIRPTERYRAGWNVTVRLADDGDYELVKEWP